MTGTEAVSRGTAATAAVAPHNPHRLSQVFALPVLMLAVAALVALFGLNQPLFLWANAGLQAMPPAFWSSTTLLGNGFAAFGLLALVLRWRPSWFAAALCTALPASLFSRIFKPFLNVPRPASVLPPDSFHLVGELLRTQSLPSGHAITAFAIAAAVLLSAPRPGAVRVLLVLAGATLIALSRVAVGAHWPLDILVGGAGGWLCGAFGAWLAMRWRWFEQNPSGFCLMIGIGAAMAIPLWTTDTGYPLAQPFQIVLAVLAPAGAIYAGWQRFKPGQADRSDLSAASESSDTGEASR